MPAPDIREDLDVRKMQNEDLKSAFRSAAIEKKRMVVERIQDNLYTDPVTGERYSVYPTSINRNSPGVVFRDGQVDDDSSVFEYTVPEGVILLLRPSHGEYYLVGTLLNDDGVGAVLPCTNTLVTIEVVDFGKKRIKGVAFSGTVDEINNGAAYRARGHGTMYNGEFGVKAVSGDVIRLKMDTPIGYLPVTWNTVTPPAGIPLSHLSLRMAVLRKVD